MNLITEKWEKLKTKIPVRLRNKYAATILFFIVWMLFFDANSLPTQISYFKKWKQLEREKQHFREAIAKAEQDKDELLNNADKIEKFARENYHMKRDNEDLFLVID